MLRLLQMRVRSGGKGVHAPTRGPTTQPSPPSSQPMRLATRRHPTAALFVAAAAPMAAGAFVAAAVQGLEAVELLPIDLVDVVRHDRHRGRHELMSLPEFAPGATPACRA